MPRTRVRRTVQQATDSVAHAEKLADTIAALQKKQERVQAEIAKNMEALQATMRSLGVKTVMGRVGVGEMYQPMGRKSTVIDPEKYYHAVAPKDFFDSVKVLMGPAKENLSGKELQSISKEIPAQKKPEELRVITVEQHSKKK